MRYNYFICPVRDLGTSSWSNITCQPNSIFVWREYNVWAPLGNALIPLVRLVVAYSANRLTPAYYQLGHPLRTIPYTPFQMHALIMATFASLVAPFGGFFASGFKRAFDIKDFGHSIPGHGGMTDRMDCQCVCSLSLSHSRLTTRAACRFLMGMFSYVYLSSVVRVHQVTIGGVLQTIVSGLSVEDQVSLVRDLLHYLDGQGVTREMIMSLGS
jgi:phosphatidate cytidylyltransferase